ncbi:MFS transporter [Nonomuraea jiangxiensis]|uniref:Predicted arabinose efflux permease, MFS family n=1 Tax=Nonomuraea jiangxiensis TaxID=633440 RepID=A0A1G9QWD0_9ACTN|nr:MFS transporter [Nonomuraea jiangxiensis]SDM15342.1 Predicted arabinose efflux permease, MFS family [Nonomuraea jiangxiensis]
MMPRRNEWILIAFTIFTNLADAVTKIALPLLAVRLTDSPALVAAVAVLITLPWLTTALHIGVFVDRLNRRTLMICAEITRIAAMAVLLGAVLTDVVNLPLIYVIAFGLGVAEVTALTSAASIVPSAVPRSRWQTVTARVTAMEYLCNGFLGAPLGGFLVAAGFAFALGATGVVYVLGAVLLLLLVGNFSVNSGQERRSVSVEIKDGLRFLWRTRLLRTMALLIAVMAGCWSAWLAIIPAYAVSGPLGLSERQFGLLMTALGAGGVVGAILTGPINRLLGRRWSMFADIIGSFLLVAVPAAMPAASSSAVPIAAAAFVAGVGGTMWTVNSRVIIQSSVPDHLLGRFNAASRLVGWGLTPVAALIAGVLAQSVGYRFAFGVFAVVCVCLVIPYLRVVTDSALRVADQPETQ